MSQHYTLPFFNEINLSQLEDTYEAIYEFEGAEISLDVNFCTMKDDELVDVSCVSKEVADTLKKHLEQIDLHLATAQQALNKDWAENSEGACQEYVEHHKEFIDELKNLSKNEVFKSIHPVRVGFYPVDTSEEGGYMTIDFTVGEDLTDYIVAVYLDEKGQVTDVTLEN